MSSLRKCLLEENENYTRLLCPLPPSGVHATVLCTRNLQLGSIARYECYEGYRLDSGEYEVKCTELDGRTTWHGEPAICKELANHTGSIFGIIAAVIVAIALIAFCMYKYRFFPRSKRKLEKIYKHAANKSARMTTPVSQPSVTTSSIEETEKGRTTLPTNQKENITPVGTSSIDQNRLNNVTSGSESNTPKSMLSRLENREGRSSLKAFGDETRNYANDQRTAETVNEEADD